MPQRIQRKRSKGWRMPDGAVYVGRPTRWGNPFTPDEYYNAGYSGPLSVAIDACVVGYREWLVSGAFTLVWPKPLHGWLNGMALQGCMPDVETLRGANLACWCRLDQPCHADVLLELANL